MEKRPVQFREFSWRVSEFVLMTIGAKIFQRSKTRWNEVRLSMLDSILTKPSQVSLEQMDTLQRKISQNTKTEYEKIISAMENILVTLRAHQQSNRECIDLYNFAFSYRDSREKLSDQVADWNSLVILIRLHEDDLNKFLQAMSLTYDRMNRVCQVSDSSTSDSDSVIDET